MRGQFPRTKDDTMRVEPTGLQDSWQIFPTTIPDYRGSFSTFIVTDQLRDETGIDMAALKQESRSRSHYGVLRGMHTRINNGEAKLVTCTRGSVYDVIVDLRPWSPTFLQFKGFHLDALEPSFLYVPPFFAHGFQATGPGQDANDFTYRLTATWGPSEERAINPLDPDLAIAWPIADLIVSEKDQNAPFLATVKDDLGNWFSQPA